MGEVERIKEIRFNGNQDLCKRAITSALKLLFGCVKFIGALSSVSMCAFRGKTCSCLICYLKNVYNSNKEININEISNKLLEESDSKLTQDRESYEPMDIINCILSALHERLSKSLIYRVGTSSNSYLKFNDHKMFSLQVEETYICKCTKSYKQEWDSLNFCQFFNMADILQKANFSATKELLYVPNKNLAHFQNRTSIVLIGNIADSLKEVLNSSLESCPNGRCSECQVKFKLKNNPDIYLINLMWECNKVTHLDCYLATLSINFELNLKSIYGDASEECFYLTGIIFCKDDTYEYAYRYENHWIFKDSNNYCSWLDLLKGVAIMMYYPTTVIYEKNKKFKDCGLNIIEKLKIEKKACQYDHFDHFYGNLINEKQISDYFNKKKLIVEKVSALEVKKNPKIAEKVPIFTEEERKKRSNELIQNCLVKNKVNTENDCPNKLEIKDSKKNPEVNRLNKFEDETKWKCFCSEFNEQESLVCKSCKQLKPGIDGWVCKACKNLNSKSNNYCFNCQNKRKDEILIGKDDQTCRGCKYSINSIYYCDECKNKKKEFSQSSLSTSQTKVRDEKLNKIPESVTNNKVWSCIKCTTINSSNSTACSQCNEEKSKQFIEQKDLWTCKSCDKVYDSTFKKCTQCKPKMDSLPEESKTPEKKIHELFRCTLCNFKSNILNECAKCKASSSQGIVSNYWKCKFCSRNNLNVREQCAYCRISRQQVPVVENPSSNTQIEWSCLVCKNQSNVNTDKCIYCGYSKGVEPLEWNCLHCSAKNNFLANTCTNCQNSKGSQPACKCGKKIGPSIKFCCDCEIQLRRQQNKEYKCTKCGNLLKSNLETCDKCKVQRNNIANTINQNQNDRANLNKNYQKQKCKSCHREISVITCKKCKEISKAGFYCQFCFEKLENESKCASCIETEEKYKKCAFCSKMFLKTLAKCPMCKRSGK